MMVLDHAADVQIFNVNHTIFCNIVIGYLVQKVIALISDFLMSFGNQNASVFPSILVSASSTQYPLANS